jgi:hypothetical protein
VLSTGTSKHCLLGTTLPIGVEHCHEEYGSTQMELLAFLMMMEFGKPQRLSF